jgi:peptidyl-tRNA hydrolase, PTH1 family
MVFTLVLYYNGNRKHKNNQGSKNGFMKLIVGLGNKGSEYAHTRHNIGFEFIDFLAAKHKFQVSAKNSLAHFSEKSFDSEDTVVIKPLTYMNLSGDAVKFFASKYKVVPTNILVIHDEIDIPPYKIKIKTGGGDGGHNGIKSIIERLATKEFPRVRIGVGKPEHKSQTVDHVLGKMDKADMENYNKKFEVVESFMLDWLKLGYTKAAGRFKDIE